jgi:2-hydroxy-3-keto-5-methylthiopentenyl-1-phosphate phosphatase
MRLHLLFGLSQMSRTTISYDTVQGTLEPRTRPTQEDFMPHSDYIAVFSSDWSECLSPNGPFDPIAFSYPEHEESLKRIFREYTGNRISLKQAVQEIESLLPEKFTSDRMDAYLDARFETYYRVPELIEWCSSRGILFMINTTGTQGYFQRAFAKNLLPRVPVVSANPFISFPGDYDGIDFTHHVLEIDDKAKNTRLVIESLALPANKLIIMGDSGGDGPHFEWGASVGAYLIGSMTKSSLSEYCRTRGIRINKKFGLSYASGESRDVDLELQANFMDLITLIEDIFDI